MKPKRLLFSAMAICLSLSFAATAVSADTWHLEEGHIVVSAADSGQTVTQKTQQGLVTKTDPAPVITSAPSPQGGQGGPAASTLTISSTGDAAAKVTLQDADIQCGGGTGIEIASGSTAVLQLEGKNSVSNQNSGGKFTSATGKAAVHVQSSPDSHRKTELTITSQSGGSLTADAWYGAAIGSNQNEGNDSRISVTGNAQIQAHSQEGAAIGSGTDRRVAAEDKGHTGTISIQDSAQVTATTAEGGAAIGAPGLCSGEIQILNQAQVSTDGPSTGLIGGFMGMHQELTKPGSPVTRFSLSTGATVNGSALSQVLSQGSPANQAVNYVLRQGLPQGLTLQDPTWKPGPAGSPSLITPAGSGR